MSNGRIVPSITSPMCRGWLNWNELVEGLAGHDSFLLCASHLLWLVSSHVYVRFYSGSPGMERRRTQNCGQIFTLKIVFMPITTALTMCYFGSRFRRKGCTCVLDFTHKSITTRPLTLSLLLTMSRA